MASLKESAGRPPRITLEQYRRIAEVRRIREAAPTDKELARELGLPVHAVTNAMRGRIRRYEEMLAGAQK